MGSQKQQAPAPAEDDESDGSGGGMEDLMGQLGFMQLASDVKMPSVPFDKNP